MGIGSAFAGGYGSGAKSLKDRSYLPMVNSLTGIIREKNRGRGMRIGAASSDNNQTRADKREATRREDMLLREEKVRHQEAQAREDKKQAENTTIMQAAEQRKQEAHDQQIAEKEQATEQKGQTFERTAAKDDRTQAYELAKQGIMMRDAKTVNKAMMILAPNGGDDMLTEEEPVDGARSFKGRPGANNLPQFIFDPDGESVGVLFPGQEKPAVFKNSEEAFKNVLAPVNPANEQTKDQITAAKNKGELDIKKKTLKADVFAKADEAGRQHAVVDGVFQSERFDPQQYEIDKAEYVAGAEGQESPKAVRARDKAAKDAKTAEVKRKRSKQIPENAYRKKAKPPGFPNARRGKGGAWFVKEGDKWVPIIDDDVEEKEKEGVESAGAPFGSKSKPRGVVKKKKTGKIVRKKVPARITAGEGGAG